MFKNREEAGMQLAKKLATYAGRAIVLAIPRGGLQVGRVIADELKIPLDCLFSKKIPLPFNEEVAIGAVSLSRSVVNEEAIAMYCVGKKYIAEKKRELQGAIKQLDEEYHANFKRLNVKGKTVILTDDGIATGETIEAAVLYLREKKVRKIVLAVPVSAPDTWKKMLQEVDVGICLLVPPFFQAIGQFYESFPQLTHEEARKLLETKLFQHNANYEGN